MREIMAALDICAELDRLLALSQTESAFFRSARIRSLEAAHALLVASLRRPSLPVPWATAERRTKLTAALEPHLKESYRGGLGSWQRLKRPGPGGAAPPSPAAFSVTVRGAETRAGDRRRVSALGRALREAPLPNSAMEVDLLHGRHRQWTIEDQDEGQTCVAFAAAACLELLRAGPGTAFTPLSAQFLYWHMRKHSWSNPLPPDWENGATKLGFAREMLAQHGICREDLCKYPDRDSRRQQPDGPKPSVAAETDARAGRVPVACYLDAPEPDARPSDMASRIHDLLVEGRPVAIAIPLFPLSPGSPDTTFNNAGTYSSGVVSDPLPDTMPVSGHAVCLVGYQRPSASDAESGGWFIFRNSVGLQFGRHRDPTDTIAPIVPARGYGAISARYVQDYCWELYSPKLT